MLSLGEYSALEAAGVFTAKQAVELAAFRGKAMADAAKGIECGMTDEEANAESSRCLRCDHFGYGIFRGGRKGKW